MIAVNTRSRALPLVAGAVAGGLVLAVPLAANSRQAPTGAVWFVVALALALLTGVAKTTTV
jgi:hypothetical protein